MKKRYFTAFTFFFCLSLSACAEDANESAKPFDMKDDSSIFTREKILNSSGSDIDGDKKSDVIESVSLKKGIDGLPAGVVVVSPWDRTSEEGQSQAQEGSHNNILITFGNSKQFLIHDVNEVSVLDTEVAKEIQIVTYEALKELDPSDLHEQAKGDVIVIPTEAGIDTYLFWNGDTFESYEPMELP